MFFVAGWLQKSTEKPGWVSKRVKIITQKDHYRQMIPREIPPIKEAYDCSGGGTKVFNVSNQNEYYTAIASDQNQELELKATHIRNECR
jgi:hypothetical protein